jgi:EAL domain-containing protein (putative c-di-GMP-specific phosphodiesterase class I)
VPPSQFIHLAEESGLVALLTPWVIETAVRQLASLAAHGPAPGQPVGERERVGP